VRNSPAWERKRERQREAGEVGEEERETGENKREKGRERPLHKERKSFYAQFKK